MVTAETHKLGKADGKQWEPLDCGMRVAAFQSPSPSPSPPGEGVARGHWGRRNARNNEKAKLGRINRQARGIKMDQGQSQMKAQAVRSRLARTNLHFSGAPWMRPNAEGMNGKAKGLRDRNTCF